MDKKILLLGLLGTGFLLTKKDKKPVSITIETPYISKDSSSICNMKNKADLDFAVAILQHKSKIDRFLSKNPEAGPRDIARYTVSLYDKYNIVPDIITSADSPAIKYLYVLSLISAIIYVGLINKSPPGYISFQLFDADEGLVKDLQELEVLELGNWHSEIIDPILESVTTQEYLDLIKSQLDLIPNLNKIYKSDIITTLLLIMLCTIVDADPQVDCTKINSFIIADYTGFSKKGINPIVSKTYNILYNLMIGMKEGE